MCPNGKNRTLFLIISAVFLISSLCFGALAHVGHKTSTTVLFNHKHDENCVRRAVRKQQREIKKKLRRIENKLRIGKNKNAPTK